MFVSSCGPCPPVLTASHLNYWASSAGQAAAAAAAAANVSIPAAEAASASYHPQTVFNQVLKRPLASSSFYISDILYPSVIPLPGTLPTQNLPPTSMAARSPSQSTGSDSHSINSSPNSVKSSQLKFGIDRILSDGKKNKKIHPECEERRGFMPVTPSSGRLVAYCPCTSASGCSMLYGSLYPPHPPPNTIASFSHNRQSDFPGPYAVLNSENHQQPQPKRKRSWSRAVFSNLQRKGLEKRFEVQKYVTKPDRRQLAAMLGLTDAQVKVWFQNRRMKWRHAEEAKRRAEELKDNGQKEKEEKEPSEKPVPSPASLTEEEEQDFKVDISDEEEEMKSPDAAVQS